MDGFRFWDYPLVMPETADPDINVYDMRIVKHQDGWIYGLFCTERKDPKAPRTLLGKGLPASPGAASGIVVFNADEAESRDTAEDADKCYDE